MKTFAAVLFLLLCLAPLIHGQKTRYGQAPPKAKPGVDYPIRVHISGIQIRQYCSKSWVEDYPSCNDVIYTGAVTNGTRIELMGYKEKAPLKYLESGGGDLQARLPKYNVDAGLITIGQKYELVFPDRTIWQCRVTGISE